MSSSCTTDGSSTPKDGANSLLASLLADETRNLIRLRGGSASSDGAGTGSALLERHMRTIATMVWRGTSIAFWTCVFSFSFPLSSFVFSFLLLATGVFSSKMNLKMRTTRSTFKSAFSLRLWASRLSLKWLDEWFKNIKNHGYELPLQFNCRICQRNTLRCAHAFCLGEITSDFLEFCTGKCNRMQKNTKYLILHFLCEFFQTRSCFNEPVKMMTCARCYLRHAKGNFTFLDCQKSYFPEW